MAYCTKCGAQVIDGKAFCTSCGERTTGSIPAKNEGVLVMANEANNNQDMEFEQMMEQRIRDNFAAPIKGNAEISDERLKEMNKKLPSWSLEPPYSFLK